MGLSERDAEGRQHGFPPGDSLIHRRGAEGVSASKVQPVIPGRERLGVPGKCRHHVALREGLPNQQPARAPVGAETDDVHGSPPLPITFERCRGWARPHSSSSLHAAPVHRQRGHTDRVLSQYGAGPPIANRGRPTIRCLPVRRIRTAQIQMAPHPRSCRKSGSRSRISAGTSFGRARPPYRQLALLRRRRFGSSGGRSPASLSNA